MRKERRVRKIDNNSNNNKSKTEAEKMTAVETKLLKLKRNHEN